MAGIYYTFLAGGLVIWPLLGLFVTTLDCALLYQGQSPDPSLPVQ